MILRAQKHALLSAMIFQAKHDVRYYLNGICFAPDQKLVSTDGHRMFIGEHESESLSENVIIKLTGPRFTSFECVEIDTDTGVASYLNEHGSRVALALAEVIDGRFPDYQRVIPQQSKPVSEISFQASLLSSVEKVAKLYNPKWQGISIKPNGANGAARIDIKGPHGSASVIVMPMRN
ncbi:DNA polymerase III subunit beta [Serratia fonticola]|uniref:hypothetical protein n=1 Tax=Serratia fonticola TaxID=47917 RepID=UPI00217BAEF6|nr:hypothetical protein [Serratia fonticola]CAI2038268.1 DNA polymerase III subunit beta [Serratia fonticola]